jgi:hypothetical protein
MQTLTARGWYAGFLASNAAPVGEILWPVIANDLSPLFLVIDYAETRRKEIVSLLREAFKADQSRRLRIVLLARAAGDWWESLKTERDGVEDLLTGPATSRIALQPLTITTSDRLFSYKKAVSTFAEALKKPEPAGIPNDLDADHFERVLLLHMSALAAIEGVQMKGEQGILDPK